MLREMSALLLEQRDVLKEVAWIIRHIDRWAGAVQYAQVA